VKLDKVLLGIVGGLCLVTAAICLLPQHEGALGVDHPVFANMRHGGSGVDRHGPMLWAGWAFGALGMVFYVALMALGTRAGAHRRAIARWLYLGLGIYLAAWTWLVLVYDTSGRSSSDVVLFLGFPAPAAIMLFVLCPVSLLLAAVYVAGFNRWVFSEEDQAAYEKLVAQARGPASSGAEKGPDSDAAGSV
jgi:hypothetical protein